MNNEGSISIEDVQNTPANVLIALSHQELDWLIQKASELLEEARILNSWLTAIKVEKTLREALNDPGKVDAHE